MEAMVLSTIAGQIEDEEEEEEEVVELPDSAEEGDGPSWRHRRIRRLGARDVCRMPRFVEV